MKRRGMFSLPILAVPVAAQAGFVSPESIQALQRIGELVDSGIAASRAKSAAAIDKAKEAAGRLDGYIGPGGLHVRDGVAIDLTPDYAGTCPDWSTPDGCGMKEPDEITAGHVMLRERDMCYQIDTTDPRGPQVLRIWRGDKFIWGNPGSQFVGRVGSAHG